MKVIVFANQKGGVGKTTTATSIAFMLHEMGKRVLLIDADPQGNSSDSFHVRINNQATLFDLLLDEKPASIAECIQNTPYCDVLASDPLLRNADRILYSDIEGIYRLKDALTALKGYDFVVIDTAPEVNSLLYNALVAATHVVIPLTADRYAVQGLSQLHSTVAAIKRRQNPSLAIAGLLLVRFHPRTNLSKEAVNSLTDIAKQLETTLFSTKIRDSVKVREAQSLRLPLALYDGKATAAQDYKTWLETELLPCISSDAR